MQIVYTQDSKKIPTAKGSVCFRSKCVKFTPAEEPVLLVEFIELEPNTTVTIVEKGKGKKRRNPFTSAPYRPDLLCVDPFGTWVSAAFKS